MQKKIQEHIQILLRLLATQFENERKDKDFDSNIRIIQHAHAIKDIFQKRALMMNTQDTTLPVAESEMWELEDKLLQYADDTRQAVTLTLPIRPKETCWISNLTQEEREKEVFVGKCGECQVQHEHPRCDQCKKPRQKSGPCSECNHIKKKEDPYQGYCGNCFQIHELPNCVQCQHYRIKPGRCTNCGAVGPDNTEWIYTCLGQDEEFKEIMMPILEARKLKVAEQNKKFTTYKNCPLCRGYFHSAKACIFRTHVKHFNLLQKQMNQYSDEINTTVKMVIPTTDSDTDSEEEEEVQYSDESEEEDCGTYMMIIHHGDSSEEESMEEDEDSFASKLKHVTMYDKILTIVATQKKEDQQNGQTEDPEEQDSQEEEDQEEEDQDQETEDQDFQDKEDHDDSDDDQHGAGQTQAKRESQPEDPADNTEREEPKQQQDQQQGGSKMDIDVPILKEVKFVVFGDQPKQTTCELTKQSFATSICKVLPDTAEFPEDIFNIEGCIWCGSKGHDVYNCLGYATWLGDIWLGPIEERRVTYPQRQKRIEDMLRDARVIYQNPRRPWELYTGLDDGEYLTERGVKILIKNMKIINLIPRHLQTTTTIYADLPTAEEMGRMLKLSTTTEPAAQITVMDELCNQAVGVKEDMLELEVELKRCFSLQITDLKKEVRQELSAISTLMEAKINSLPQQLVSFREYLSKSLANLHKRSLQSDLTLVDTYRTLSDAKSADSCMTWRSTICQNDPSYHLRGRWRQLSDRLNYLDEYILRNNLVVPTTDRKHAEELKEVSTLLGEVMYQMFYRAGILENEDMFDMEDFWSFQETVCRSLEMQAISPNQVCNFIQQILYYDQCEKKKFTTYMDCQRQVEVFIGILIQTTLKVWDKPGNCKCNFEDKLTCRHSYRYSILRQHFPNFGLTKLEVLVELLDSISNQTCDCSKHAALPMHGPSKYIKAPIPAYYTLQELHLKNLPGLHQPNLQDLYVRGVMSWIYSRLFQYLTPYSDPTMNKEPGLVPCSAWEFYLPEKQFLENRLSIMDSEAPLQTIWEQVLELGDLKKTHCQCQVHREDRETNLLYQLKLHNTCGNRELVNRVLQSKPLWIYCPDFFLHADHWHFQPV